MKITVEHLGTIIAVDEQANETQIRWSDQNKRLQELITAMANQVKSLHKDQPKTQKREAQLPLIKEYQQKHFPHRHTTEITLIARCMREENPNNKRIIEQTDRIEELAQLF